MVRAEKTTCFALTEPEAGSDAQAIRTSARLDGDEWVIDGMKHYITNGDAADFAIVFAVTDAEKRAAGGITAFVVPREQYRVGKMQATIADAHPSELWFDGARVPADHVIGEVGPRLPDRDDLPQRRPGRVRRAVARAGRVLPRPGRGAREDADGVRQAAGRQPGGVLPARRVQGRDRGDALDDLPPRLGGRPGRDRRCSTPRSRSSTRTERAYAVADRCLQVFGGMGLLREGPVERVLRHLRVLRVVEGASEVQKLVIARSLGLG